MVTVELNENEVTAIVAGMTMASLVIREIPPAKFFDMIQGEENKKIVAYVSVLFMSDGTLECFGDTLLKMTNVGIEQEKKKDAEVQG